MYFLVGILLLLVLFLSLFHHHRKKKICKRICSMSCDDKLEQITSLIEPFGYTYIPCQDIFSTTIDAPQRAFGYTALYDYYAHGLAWSLTACPFILTTADAPGL